MFGKLALLALILCAAACSRTPPEQALRRDVAALQAAIEQRDPAALREYLADDFIGNDGLDRDGARRLAAVYFMRSRDIGVTLGPLDITVQDEHATVRCTAVLTERSGGLLPDTGQIYHVTSGWRLEGGDWRMTSVDWKGR